MMGNVGIGASCYPRPLQTKRDASQVASIHLVLDRFKKKVCFFFCNGGKTIKLLELALE